jgi:hypothetical protein
VPRPEGNRPLDLGIGGEIILTWILKMWNENILVVFI